MPTNSSLILFALAISIACAASVRIGRSIVPITGNADAKERGLTRRIAWRYVGNAILIGRRSRITNIWLS